MDPKPTTRLNKFLALQLGLSRRQADDLIADGRVTVDGDVAVLGARVDEASTITVDKKTVSSHAVDYRYVLFNKPVGYVSSRRKQGESDTIYAILPDKDASLKPVGRLDRDSSGLLILTNDGSFAHTMTHPSFKKTKVYEVTLDKTLEPLHQQMISDHGVALEDGVSQFNVSRIETGQDDYEVTMSEGRNRQIRRTFAALGYTVTRLHRTQFGPYTLEGLQPGEFKSIQK